MTGHRSQGPATRPSFLSLPLYPVLCTLYPIPYAAMPTLQQKAREAILPRAEDKDLCRMLRPGKDDRIALPRDLFLSD